MSRTRHPTLCCAFVTVRLKMLSRTTTLLFATLVLPLCACSSASSITTLPLNPGLPVTVGGDRDAHGCIGSAGFSWSEVLGRCVQPFNEGKQLLPVDAPQDGTAVFASYVIFSEDGNRAEIFSLVESDRGERIAPQPLPHHPSCGSAVGGYQ